MTSPALSLRDLLMGFTALPAAAEVDLPITGLAGDSRQIKPGNVFLATRGLHHHGLEFFSAAKAADAAAVLWEPPFAGELPKTSLPLIAVEDLSRKLGLIARRYYGEPSRTIDIVGVTGTDGKTSCAHLIAQALHSADQPCGILGTLGHGVFGAVTPATHTTPDALTLQRCLAELHDAKARFAAMEVSSHALAQNRVAGVDFTAAVLTNLGRDHLDFHGDLASYAAAKARLFLEHQPRWAVLNMNDSFGQQLLPKLRGPTAVIGYGLGEQPPAGLEKLVWGEAPTFSAQGMTLQVRSSWGSGTLTSPLLGDFNASNLLATLAALLALGMPFTTALQRLARATPIMGRMERFGGAYGQPLVVVDYAHTPQALEHALHALREHCAGRLWCVFGCGGERDAGKRPLMGAIAEQNSDQVIVTNDNPRGEDPQQILKAIQAGMQHPEAEYVQVIPDRFTAIHQAIGAAAPTDVVLVAGKGHEAYQLVGDQCLAFSDRAVVQDCLATRAQTNDQRRAFSC